MKKDEKYREMLVDTSKIDEQLDLIAEEVDKITSDLDDYVKNSDYATTSKAGIILASDTYNTAVLSNSGALYAKNNDYAAYQTKGNGAFIGKGTLEAVITGRELDPTQWAGYDATKIQTLKNVAGHPTWITDEE